ncbi:MAG: hypothetical protein ACNS60_17450 [Candidatus Cyclobacteriaceae bacterium M2_1C_046]
MADIRVEKKSKPVWPWILAILIAAAVIWVIADDDDEYGEEIGVVTTEQEYEERQNAQDTLYRDGQRGEEDAAMAYVNFIEENGDNVTKSHEYSHQALTHLSKAVKEVAEENNVSIENKDQLDNLEQQANKLMKERSSAKHADIMANAFNSAATVISNVQEKQYPDMAQQANELEKAAEEVKPGVLATNQKDAIKNFFDKAANTLEAMNTEDQNVTMK